MSTIKPDFDTIIKFLLGEVPLDGMHFGDTDTARPRGRYWWRDNLRAALATKDAPALEAVPDEHQQFIDSLDAEDKMFAQIEKWAHESYRRHRSSVRGQQVTAADDPNSHYIWAALRWAKENPAKQEAAPLAAPGWISVHERLPEVDELVLLYWPPGPYDHPNEPNYGFDCIDPNDDERASWMGHNENYEHFCCVAKPEGSVGPASKAPYTHWMPLPAAPTNAKESTS